MKKYIEKLKLNINYPVEALGDPNKLLIFDIETTGLSSSNSSLYMIAALTLEPNNYILTQWFADDMSDEQEMLKDFFCYLSDFDTVISYNGDTFDIPYIKSCALSYHMLSPLDDKKNLDLYKLIRRHPHVFGDAVARTPEESLALWKEIKAKEKEMKRKKEEGKSL